MSHRNLQKMYGLAILGFSLVTLTAGRSDLRGDFPGPYCEQRNTCCDNRKDACAVPIETTLCYCDQFCDRDRGDCCPDYESFCLNIRPEPIRAACYHNGKYYKPFETFQDNCNKCTCSSKGLTECEEDVCLLDNDLIENVNRIHRLGWTAGNYSEFWGRKYKEGLRLRLGTLEPTYRVKSMSRLSNRGENIPKRFNAIDHWPNLIRDVPDQGWCGSSWVISTTSVASDRFAIHSKGQEDVELSAQNILSCMRRQRGCDGGHLDAAWRYLHKQGVVDEECYPYTANTESCKVRRPHTLRAMGCHQPQKVDRDSFYTVAPAYSLNNETDIMLEIMRSGPVQATLRVYRDFFAYNGGIYRRSAATRQNEHGFHAVKLVGWGEERMGYETVKYWIAANSWGTWWGENGYFRILRGVNECLIEDYVLASWPHVYTTHHVKGSRPT